MTHKNQRHVSVSHVCYARLEQMARESGTKVGTLVSDAIERILNRYDDDAIERARVDGAAAPLPVSSIPAVAGEHAIELSLGLSELLHDHAKRHKLPVIDVLYRAINLALDAAAMPTPTNRSCAICAGELGADPRRHDQSLICAACDDEHPRASGPRFNGGGRGAEGTRRSPDHGGTS